MLHRIFGRAGSGKTQYMLTILKEMQSMGMDCLFLVPEQQSLTAEMAIERAGRADFNTEVLNFERLPNRVFREIGGLCGKSVDGVGRCVLICAALSSLKEELRLFRKVGKDTVAGLVSTVSTLKRLLISPDRLMEIATELEKGKKAEEGLIIKLKETALIYAEYQKLLGDATYDDDDALTRLAEAKGAADFFRGKAVFLDGLYTYTPQQYEIIKLIGRNAAELYVSFTADKSESGIFDGTISCAERIKKLCGKTEDIHLDVNFRVKSKALAYGEENFWAGGKVFEGDSSDLEIVSCKSRYEEALYAASTVFALKEKGLRYNEIAIAVRNPDVYTGVLDTVFASYNIPFYFGNKDSAASKPLTAAVLALLEMAEGRIPLTAVKKYLKTTFSVLSDEEADILIRYGEAWDIKGKAWISDKDFLMNPEGYKSSFSEEAEAQLRRVNEARRAFAASVGDVIEALRSRTLTVGKAVSLIYDHLKQCGVAEKLTAAAERLINLGDADGGAKTAALWGVLIDIFDRLYTLAGDKKTTASEMLLFMEAMLSNTDVGAIPSYTDAVNIGDARLIRADGVRAMIILGVNEGEFPSLPSASGVFSARDSAVLEKMKVELLPSVDKAINEERFFFYNCASAPSDYLFVSFVSDAISRPSPIVTTLLSMYGREKERAFGEDYDYLFCRKAALDAMPYIKNAAFKAALKQALCADSAVSELLAAPPLQDTEAYIGESEMEVCYLSYSSVDCYNNCGFAYLMKYKLYLKDNSPIDFGMMDSGTYMHHLMEMYLTKRMESGSYVPADKAETVAEIAAISDEYIKQIMPVAPKKRLLKLLDRLQNAAVFICEDMNKEFMESDFAPRGFEVKIGRGGLTPPKLISPKGIDVRLNGSIDRVDTAYIDGKPYVRVVDYKSSGHNVKREDVSYGEGIQMLSYLFAYCDATEDTSPAGVLYRSFALPGEDGKLPAQMGLIVDDEAVINAMGKRFNGMKSKLTESDFSEIKTEVYGHITATADRIAEGVMNVLPFKKREVSCDYCAFGAVCRMKKKGKKFSW